MISQDCYDLLRRLHETPAQFLPIYESEELFASIDSAACRECERQGWITDAVAYPPGSDPARVCHPDKDTEKWRRWVKGRVRDLDRQHGIMLTDEGEGLYQTYAHPVRPDGGGNVSDAASLAAGQDTLAQPRTRGATTPPRVFISYSHDSDAHAKRVLELSDRLRGDGVDCTIDQYVTNPSSGWPLWMDEQVEQADFVIIVSTEAYTQKSKAKKRSGVKFESVLILQDLYDAGMLNDKFIPVLFDASDAVHIVKWLRPFNYYRVDTDDGCEALRRRLLDDPAVVAPPVGTPVKRGPKKPLAHTPQQTAPPAASQQTTAPPDKVSIGHLPQPGKHFVGRDEELALLDNAWPDDRTNVVELVAFGGVGKSALVAHWLIQMGQENWRGALRVLGHSFYSQGSREDAQASADAFIAEALEFFGDDDPTAGSPWEKGERLARHVRSAPTLLILDGVEPLQYPPTSGDAGRIRDPGLAALVRELAAQNNGLCVITTRHSIEDITWLEDTSVTKVDLDYLAKEAGAELLRQLGVKGNQSQLEQASKDVKGHGLALTLMGNYLRKACHGDVERRGEIGLLEADEEQGGHARRVIERYELWLSGKVGGGADVTESGRAALDILRLMGLFDRPVTAGEFAALCADDPIPGLTDALTDANDRRLELAVSMLAECGLITRPSHHAIILRPSEPKTTVLDAHPLVREHFAQRLAAEHEDATREAHHRLYEYLKQSAPKLPDNLQDMMPLYHAVAHGCNAGLHEEVYRALYDPRIQRGEQFFSTSRLGAFGADLASMANFFDVLWERPIGTVPEELQSEFLSVVGFHLRAVGRLSEAAQPMRASVDQSTVELKDWRNAAARSCNLSELYLTLGDVSAAVRLAEQSVELADRGGDADQRMINRTKLTDALRQAACPGSDQYDRALAAFEEAEAMQAELHAHYPVLYSVQGFEYCELLLDEPSAVSHQLSASIGRQPLDEATREAALARIREVRRRAEYALEEANDKDFPLDAGLDHLTLGRTWLLEALLVGPTVRTDITDDQSEETIRTAAPTDWLANAERQLNESVSLLRQAGTQHHLPRGLLARAALWRVKEELAAAAGSYGSAGQPRSDKPTVPPDEALAQAEKDLREAESIAQRGSMLVFQIDAAIERCRFHIAAASLAQTSSDDAEPDPYAPARESLALAKELIEQTDKPYEPHVPDWSDWQPPEYVGVFKKGDIVGYHRRDPEIAQLESALMRCQH